MANEQRTPVHPLLRALGKELKLARQRQNISQQELAKEIHFSDSLISAVETGRRPASGDLIYRADDVLHTNGLLGRILDAAQEAATREIMPDWFRPWAEIEETATALRAYQQLTIDGLLQTPAYARAILQAGMPTADDETLQRTTDARFHRQHVLDSDTPPQLIMILEEAALHRPVGSPTIMRDQLEALAHANTTGRAEIHILPTDVGAHRGMSGSFVLASLPDAPDVVYIDTHLRGLLIEAPADIDATRRIWEGLLGEALPRRLSTHLIKEVAQKWKT
ncbi:MULTISPECIES: helix-turn-helix domain-containing protein [Catenuloplanes]|uniref:Transcriptional regulator with XRE-family HTH domain n=1 Tax=Catenuloplanes niger TaxID=587534 RepID=A0AAE3ZSH2_9ACTN|nr:helix-turn-helix transcriptional regulator [Catenuloplanes niger]MDR7324167.1 transcriptional regulator with XRE-family HTH domain [Catenuloplanes niger]